MITEQIKNPDLIFSFLTKNGSIVINEEERTAIVNEINQAVWFTQTCYAGKDISVPRITKAKNKITKHIDELLIFLDAEESSIDKKVRAFHQAIFFSKEDSTYFGQLSCGLIQLKNELQNFYNPDKDFRASSGCGAKKDDFNILINCLLKIYKKYHSFNVSVRAPSTLKKKGYGFVAENKLIAGNTIDFILAVCSELTFHDMNKNELKNKIKNCYDKYPKN